MIRSISIITFFVLHLGNLRAQKPDVLLSEFNQKYPQEKIHIHFDKDVYVAGETIWLKAYLLAELLPDNISSSLFVELINGNGKLIRKINLPIFGGAASSNFDLPDSLPAGYYTIQAYTTWMLNFDKGFLYTKKIFIYNTSANAQTTAVKNENYTVNFFPEGGNLVADVANFVAFKATDANGYPVSVSGSIVDSKDNVITEVTTTHDGMGSFTLLTQSGEKYFSKLKFDNGKVATVELPAVMQHGIAMHITRNAKQIKIQLSRSSDNANEIQALFILGQIEDHTVFKTNIILKGEGASLPVIYDNFPSGILQITIFDTSWKPMLERLTFINNEEYKINSTLKTDTFNSNKRAKNVFTFSVPDTLDGNYSMAVTDEDKTVNEQDRDNIISRFLLTSDIKGYVHDPAFYFDKNDKFTRDALELVMMTNGWRRFKWEQILANHNPEIIFKPLHYIRISGKVFAENKKDIITEGNLNFFLHDKADSSTIFFSVPIDPQGNFVVDSLIFSDTANLYFNYNTKRKNKKQVYLKLDEGSAWPEKKLNDPTQYYFVESKLLDSLKLKMNKNIGQLKFYNDYISKIIQLKEIRINARKRSPTQLVNERYSSSIFSTPNAKMVDLITDPVTNSMSLETLIRSRIPGVDITGTPGNRRLVSVFGGQSIMRGPQQVSVYLDEFETDFTSAAYTPVDEIALIKYVSSFVGNSGNGPALFIYRKLPQDMGGNTSKYLANFNFPGYSVTREFYSPDYSMPEKITAPDIRTTLYWNAEILLGKQKQNETIRFYNADDCHKMRVVIEGFNAAGKLCRIEKVIGN